MEKDEELDYYQKLEKYAKEKENEKLAKLYDKFLIEKGKKLLEFTITKKLEENIDRFYTKKEEILKELKIENIDELYAVIGHEELDPIYIALLSYDISSAQKNRIIKLFNKHYENLKKRPISLEKYDEEVPFLSKNKKLQLLRYKVESKKNICSWYKSIGKLANPAAVVFITPNEYEIETATSTERHQQAARNLFYKYFKKDLDKEIEDSNMDWYFAIPKNYNTITMQLVFDKVIVNLPEDINEYQLQILKKFNKELEEYDILSSIKVVIHASKNIQDDDEEEFESIDEMIEHFYGKERRK